MKRNQHHIRYGNSVHMLGQASAGGKSASHKTWHSLLTWNTRLDEDTLEALTEALRPRRPRVE